VCSEEPPAHRKRCMEITMNFAGLESCNCGVSCMELCATKNILQSPYGHKGNYEEIKKESDKNDKEFKECMKKCDE
jgi:hypothetical protein